jgi:hypothetical protein
MTADRNVEFTVNGNAARVLLKYPTIGPVAHIEIDMEGTRAADGIRVHYDHERDGWVIEQASRFRFHVGEEPDPGWQEIHFVRAWAREDRSDPELYPPEDEAG